MSSFNVGKGLGVIGLILCLCGLLLSLGGDSSQAKQWGFSAPQSGKRFASKECLDCHKKFEEKYFGTDWMVDGPKRLIVRKAVA